MAPMDAAVTRPDVIVETLADAVDWFLRSHAP